MITKKYFMKIWGPLKKLPYLSGIFICLFIFMIYSPALDIYLFGDGYQLLDFCYSGWNNPSVFFEVINNFFRPIVNFSYLFNYTFFKENIFFYRLTSLFIHLANVFLLYLLLLKVTGKRTMAAVTVLLFGTSPMYSGLTIELGFTASPDITLLLFFLGILLGFAGKKETFGIAKQFFIFFCVAGAIGSKESWVILPLLLMSFLLLIKKCSFKRALVSTLPIWVLTLLYSTILFFIPLLTNSSSALNYSGFDFTNMKSMATKMFYLLCRYVGLAEYFHAYLWQLITVFILGAGFLAGILYLKNNLALWGMCVMCLGNIPTLPLPYTPSRFNYIPLVGFWIMIVAVIEQIVQIVSHKFHRQRYYLSLGIGMGIIYLVTYNTIMLQWEMKDYRRLGESCKIIVSMYKNIKDQIPVNQPLVFINKGTRQVVKEVAASVQGYQKLFFVRAKAIWQLIYFAQLANFAGEPFTYRMIPIQADRIGTIFSETFQVIIFTDRGFYLSHKYEDILRELYLTHKQLPHWVQGYTFIPLENPNTSEISER